MSLRAVILDMGGVLLDVKNETGIPEGRLDFRGREHLAEVIRETGGQVAAEQLEELLFAPWRRDYERRYERQRDARWEPHLKALRQATGSRAHNRTLLAAWFAPYADGLRAIDGALATVEQLRERGFRMAVVSNVALPGEHYERILRREGFLHLLAHRFWSYDQRSRKPSPAMVRSALQALGVEPADAVFVGDRRSTDVAAGLAAGVRTIWLRSKHHAGPKPDLEIESIRELPAALERWR